MQASADLITQRLQNDSVATRTITAKLIAYKFDKNWSEWYTKSLSGATREHNLDVRPVAVYQTLLLWNKKFSPGWFSLLRAAKGLRMWQVIAGIACLAAALFFWAGVKRNRKVALTYAIATTGFFGMLSTLMLIFSFQVYHGYLYYRIGILMSIFMAGASCASILMAARAGRLKHASRVFLFLEIAVAAFSLLLGVLIARILGVSAHAPIIYAFLFFICGAFLGLQFPLAGLLYLGKKEEVGEASASRPYAPLIRAAT